MKRGLISRLAMLVLSVAMIACGDEEGDADPTAASTTATAAAGSPAALGSGPAEPTEDVDLRLGYFPNITHAQPLVGIERGTYEEELGAKITLKTQTFNAGPSAIEALFAGAIDATYVGPNPAINGYMQSEGKDVRIVAGATSGGAMLVVRPAANITKPADFAGKKVASPQLGNTQDVALRAWLQGNGLKDRDHGGNVQVIPSANADTLSLFQRGDVDAAWVPEPWGTRLIQEAGGKVFLDERELWPNGDFVTTHLVVRAKFLEEHPEVVERLLIAHVKTTQWINDNPEEAKKLVNQGIKDVTNAALPDAVINAAWPNQEITYDPVTDSLRKSADDAYSLGYLQEKPDLGRIYELELLNRVLGRLNLPTVQP